MYKQHFYFTKEQLEDLYVSQKLSLSQMAAQLNCSSVTILRALAKYGISRRPAYRKKIPIAKDVLHDLYWNQKKKPIEIARMFGIKNERTIRKKMEKFCIKRRTLSEAMTTKMKLPFTGDLIEKAYLLGLRTGDFHAKRVKKCVRVQTSTTHPAQYEMVCQSFGKYGEPRRYLYKNAVHGPEWFIYVDLHPSFEFLVQKPERIPSEIMKDHDTFFAFLAAYADCEVNLNLTRSHKNSLRFVFTLRSHDKLVLQDLKENLKLFTINSFMCLHAEAGYITGFGPYSKDHYELTVGRKSDFLNLIEKILQFSQHSEKLAKMKHMLKYCNSCYSHAFSGWRNIRKEIKNEILK